MNIQEIVSKNGFSIDKKEFVMEIDADVYLMSHQQTKAKLIYIEAEDDNKVFSVSFRTPPMDSTGVAHILEHSVLCGSEKFPLKEPFVELVKGSLNTFLNAMTFPDKTMYPVASRNGQDFYNLMDVYLDAVFFPNIRSEKRILDQEGWHYELETPDDEIIYKGVVFNEMKGALSSPDDVLQTKLMEMLFPDTTYRWESGGDPQDIPNLTYEQFMTFYESHYHPSNSYFFLYGDMDIDKTLKLIQSYLTRFSYREVNSEIMPQVPLKERQKAIIPFGIAEEESTKERSIHGIEIVLPDSVSGSELMIMNILNYALLVMPGAILRERIVQAGLGSDVSGTFSNSIRYPIWHIEVVGSESEHGDEILRLFDETITELCENGMNHDVLQSSFNRMEFLLRENDFRGRPKGLLYNIRAMNYWLYNKSPMEGLRYERDLEIVKQGLFDGSFEEVLKKYVLHNTHQAFATMIPVKGLTEEKEAQIKAYLKNYKEGLTAAEIEDLCYETATLKKWQNREDTETARESIPLLKRSDLPRDIETDQMQRGRINDIEWYHFEGDSKGILYTNMYFSLASITPAEYPYVVLLAEVLGNMDTKQYSYSKLAQQINMFTGGINIGVSVYPHYKDANSFNPYMVVQGKALTSNAPILLRLIGEVINHTEYQKTSRLQELINERKADWNMQLFRRGHALMMNRVLSYVSEAESFIDAGELSYYDFLRSVKETDIDSIAHKLQEVSRKVFSDQNLIIQSVGGPKEVAVFQQEVINATMDLSTCSGNEKPSHWPLNTGNEAFLSVGKVQYVAQGGNFSSQGFFYTGVMQVLETILRYEYLWQRVRVLGGAYGAFARFATNGNVVFCSYRDPNLKETLQVYQDMASVIESICLSARQMDQYIIGTLATTQTQYTLPMKADRVMGRMLSEITDSFRQQVRNQIIDCNQSDIRGLGCVIAEIVQQKHFAVMGGASKINENKELFKSIRSFS